MDKKKEAILKAAQALTENYKKEELFMPKERKTASRQGGGHRSGKRSAVRYLPRIFLRGHRGPYLSGAVQHLLSE